MNEPGIHLDLTSVILAVSRLLPLQNQVAFTQTQYLSLNFPDDYIIWLTLNYL